MEVSQIYEIMNSVTGEILGESAVLAEDLTNIVDIGTEIFNANAIDNYVRSLVNHIGRVVFVNRPYSGNVPSVLMDGWEYGSVLEKITADLPEATDKSTAAAAAAAAAASAERVVAAARMAAELAAMAAAAEAAGIKTNVPIEPKVARQPDPFIRKPNPPVPRTNRKCRKKRRIRRSSSRITSWTTARLTHLCPMAPWRSEQVPQGAELCRTVSRQAPVFSREEKTYSDHPYDRYA